MTQQVKEFISSKTMLALVGLLLGVGGTSSVSNLVDTGRMDEIERRCDDGVTRALAEGSEAKTRVKSLEERFVESLESAKARDKALDDRLTEMRDDIKYLIRKESRR